MIKADEQKIDDILTRGVDEIIDKDHLRSVLVSGKKIRVKLGIDPTSPNLHIGRSIPLLKLRDFQELGHKIIFLIGDFTAKIGDPSGRDTTRPIFTHSEIKKKYQ